GAQLETRVQITDTIGLVGFYDIGLISADTVPGEDSLWQAGAGFGLRYNTAIGPIRLDIATPASGPDAGRDIQFYVGLGQSF
ncbi:MAG: BamA/TamA family outer membrane protein, partial [Rhodobacteraceae bacterium]|nr:BamA/TamA family outer membrane protein [Paracoccaceae bacterium]